MWRPPTACPVLFMKVLVKVWFTTGLPCASPKVRTNTSPNPTNTEVVFGFFIELYFLCLFCLLSGGSRLTGSLFTGSYNEAEERLQSIWNRIWNEPQPNRA